MKKTNTTKVFFITPWESDEGEAYIPGDRAEFNSSTAKVLIEKKIVKRDK